jgi:WD40 repeat protein
MTQDSNGKPSAQETPPELQPGFHEMDTVVELSDIRKSWAELLRDNQAAADTIKPPDDGSQIPPGVVVKPRTLLAKGQPSDGDAEFELLSVIGEGGMGIVYAARQTALGRDVAIKLVSPKGSGSGRAHGRFLSEAAITAELEHPNVIPVYDLGADSAGTLFYAMKWSKGTPWRSRIKKMSLRRNLDVLLSVADAVAFAHSRGVIHRDLKPDNVLLGDYGEVLLADWGLAVRIGATGQGIHLNRRTAAGGTPAYMAPEMANQNPDLIGPCSDVYLLGGILYRILTGHTPHSGADTMGCLFRAAKNMIQPIGDDGELAAIAMKALATQPQDRYPDVPAFRNAIQLYREHEGSILATDRAAAHLARARTTNNYDDFAQALFGFRDALVIWVANDAARAGLAETRITYATCALEHRDYDLAESLLEDENPAHGELLARIRAGRRERDERRDRMERTTYIGQLALAEKKIGQNHIDEADRILDQCDSARRGWEWGHLKSICNPTALRWHAHEGVVSGVATDEEHSRIASCGEDGYVRLWDAESFELLWEAHAHAGGANAVSFSPDGDRFLSAGEDGAVRLWNPATGDGTTTFLSHTERVTQIAWLPEGRRFVSASDDGRLLRWEIENESRPTVLWQDTGEYGSVITFARGDWVQMCSADDEEYSQVILHADDGAVVEHRQNSFELMEKGQSAFSEALGAAGELSVNVKRVTIAVGCPSRPGWWVTAAGTAARSCGRFAAASPTGRRLAIGRGGSQIVLFELPDADSLQDLPLKTFFDLPTISQVAERDASAQCIAWLGEGHVVAGNNRGELVQWTARLSAVKPLTGHRHLSIGVCWVAPDALWTTSWDGTIRLWDATTGRQTRKESLGAAWGYDVHAFDANTLVLGARSGVLSGQGEEARIDTMHSGGTFSAEVRVVDPTTGRTTACVQNRGTNCACHTESARIATMTKHNHIQLHRLPDLTLETEWSTPHEQIVPLEFSPDGARLLTGCLGNHLVCVWDVSSGRCVRQLRAHDSGVTRIACAQDVFATGDHGHAMLWRWDADEPYAVLDVGNSVTHGLSFSPDGRRLATLAADGVCKIWDVATGDELLDLSQHVETGGRVAFSPDGRRLFVSSTRDNACIVLDAGTWI